MHRPTCLNHLKRVTNLNHAALCVFCELLFHPALANDGIFYASGNQLIPWQCNEISVQKEVLTITLLSDEEAQVDVYYEFLNHNEAKEQLVGFEAIPPEHYNALHQSGIQAEHPYMRDFKVSVNDHFLPFQSAIVARDSTVLTGEGLKVLDPTRYEADESKSGNYLQLKGSCIGIPITYVYFFTARFEQGVNRVHHTYNYRMSEELVSRYALDYMLTPALRWANHQIDDFTLRIVVKDQGMHFFLLRDAVQYALSPYIHTGNGGSGKMRRRNVRTCNSEEDVPVWEFSVRNATIEIKAKDYQPSAELRLEAADYSESGTLLLPDFTARCRESYTKEEKAALPHLGEAELGMKFKDKKLQQFYNNCWWYMPQK